MNLTFFMQVILSATLSRRSVTLQLGFKLFQYISLS